jgi:uncharacterized protein involved in response to NO
MLNLEDPQPRTTNTAPTLALWNLGFRPFYLLASLYAAGSVLLWSLEATGWLGRAYLRLPAWHAHEMVFGFALAVITGFLFTAVRNWTGQGTPTGVLLVGYAALWICARVLVLTRYGIASALVNALFPLAVAAGIGVPLVRSGNRRNDFFVALLVGLAAASLAVQLSALGIASWPERIGVHAGLDIVLFLMSVVGGRVIPMFTNNGIPGTRAMRHPLVEKLALGGVLAILAADLLSLDAGAFAVLALAVAAVHALRLLLWQPWRTLSTPLVWILHAAYGWIVLHLMLRALASLGHVAAPLAVHALTVGAIGGLTLGMMTRTARGHTGRALTADRFEIACFLLVQLAALLRVFGGMLLPQAYSATIVASAACWSSAFALYAIRYWPILTRPRVDGKPG